MSYYELWNVMSQWREEFTTKEFASTFVSPDPSKVLHDMWKKGLLGKMGRAKYRVIPQKEYVMTKANMQGAYDTVEKSGLPYAFTGPDAVFIWTKGGYSADRFFGFYPITLKVKKKDLKKWQNYLESEKCKWIVEGKQSKETLYGVFYYLRPVENLRRSEKDGYSVDSLNETVRFCKDKSYTYEPALEMLDEMYDLGMGIKYRQFK